MNPRKHVYWANAAEWHDEVASALVKAASDELGTTVLYGVPNVTRYAG